MTLNVTGAFFGKENQPAFLRHKTERILNDASGYFDLNAFGGRLFEYPFDRRAIIFKP